MVDQFKIIEKRLLEKRRKQLRDGLLKVAQVANDTNISATSVSKIKTASQWSSALDGLKKRGVARAEKVNLPAARIKSFKETIKKLKPMWNKLK